MANWFIPAQITRHQSGAPLVPGTAPLVAGAAGIKPGQLVMDDVGGTLWIGVGNDGSGNSTGIVPVGGTRGVRFANNLIMI